MFRYAPNPKSGLEGKKVPQGCRVQGRCEELPGVCKAWGFRGLGFRVWGGLS